VEDQSDAGQSVGDRTDTDPDPERYPGPADRARAAWSFLGPAGTFTEQAALELRDRLTGDGESVDLSPASSVPAALDAVRSGSAVAACVPLENSIEGAVPLTHDELTHGTPLVICAEAYVPVTFQLLARPGTILAGVRSVGSHPHGLAQVREYLDRELPEVRIVVTDSTAAAAEAVADGTLDAAAAAPVAGRHYGLDVLADDIGLVRDAITRFVLLRPRSAAPPATGNDRTSMILSVANQPGTLLAVLTEFAARGINLTRLESRPTRASLGEYVFLVDADGHVTDPAVADVLAALIRREVLLRYLGSYPRMRGRSVAPPAFASPGRYVAAAQEVAALAAVQLPAGRSPWASPR
jgi:prephenate dehydratase